MAKTETNIIRSMSLLHRLSPSQSYNSTHALKSRPVALMKIESIMKTELISYLFLSYLTLLVSGKFILVEITSL